MQRPLAAVPSTGPAPTHFRLTVLGDSTRGGGTMPRFDTLRPYTRPCAPWSTRSAATCRPPRADGVRGRDRRRSSAGAAPHAGAPHPRSRQPLEARWSLRCWSSTRTWSTCWTLPMTLTRRARGPDAEDRIKAGADVNSRFNEWASPSTSTTLPRRRPRSCRRPGGIRLDAQERPGAIIAEMDAVSRSAHVQRPEPGRNAAPDAAARRRFEAVRGLGSGDDDAGLAGGARAGRTVGR